MIFREGEGVDYRHNRVGFHSSDILADKWDSWSGSPCQGRRDRRSTWTRRETYYREPDSPALDASELDIQQLHKTTVKPQLPTIITPPSKLAARMIWFIWHFSFEWIRSLYLLEFRIDFAIAVDNSEQWRHHSLTITITVNNNDTIRPLISISLHNLMLILSSITIWFNG